MSQIEKLIFNNVIKPIPIIITLFFFWNYQFSNKSKARDTDRLIIIFLLSVALVFCSPTSMPVFKQLHILSFSLSFY